MTTIDVTPRLQTGHVGLNVSDLARASRFYQDVFGFQVMHESVEPGREFAFLSEGDVLVLTLWQQSHGRFGADGPGLHHLSFMVPTVNDVRAAEERARTVGARFFHDGIVPHTEGARSGGIFFEDPDGIRLEIFAPTGAEGQNVPTVGAPTCGFF